MALGRLGNKSGKKSSFSYKPSYDASSMRQRASQKGGNFESVVVDHVKTWTPKEGDHDIRVLPPTWDSPQHFGLEVWQHYGIGPDENTYICLQKMKDEACPMCEERGKLGKDDPLSDALRPNKRVAVWVINRKEEAEGPVLWTAPWTFDRDLCTLAVDKKTGEVFQLDNPDEGYDVSFKITGEGVAKKYSGIQVDRRPSPLHEDQDVAAEWLRYVTENPIPDILNYKDYEYLAEMLMGGVRGFDKDGKAREEGEGKKDVKPSRLGRAKEREVEKGQEMSWDDVHSLDQEGLEQLVAEKGLSEEEFAECGDEGQIADRACELLKIEKPKARPQLGRGRGVEAEAGKQMTLKERLAAMRAKREG